MRPPAQLISNVADDLSPATVEEPRGIFGVPLNVSIKYANVAISLTNDNGESFIYGYVPIVVAKCGVFLKEKGERAPLPIIHKTTGMTTR